MITHKDVAHFYDLMAEELRLSAQFSRHLAQNLFSGERRIMGSLHSAGVESFRDAVSLHDLPHYPLNFIGLPPKYLDIYISSLLLFFDTCSALSRFGFASVERVAKAGQAQD